jgi:hypothetical protein
VVVGVVEAQLDQESFLPNLFFGTTLIFSFGQRLVTSIPTKKSSLKDFTWVTTCFLNFFLCKKLFEHGLREDRNDDDYTEVMLFAALACCINPLAKTGKRFDPLLVLYGTVAATAQIAIPCVSIPCFHVSAMLLYCFTCPDMCLKLLVVLVVNKIWQQKHSIR